MSWRVTDVATGRFLPDPTHLRALFADVRLAPLWLVVRLVLGWFWLEAGWSRLQTSPLLGDPAAAVLVVCGVALMLGVLTGVTAFVGGSLSVGFWASAGPGVSALLFAAVVSLMLAWKIAGWLGFDHWLLPLLGMPWRGGALLQGRSEGERRSW